jgi:hypothetical protein
MQDPVQVPPLLFRQVRFETAEKFRMIDLNVPSDQQMTRCPDPDFDVVWVFQNELCSVIRP